MKKSGVTKEAKPSQNQTFWEQVKAVSAKINHIIDVIGTWLFRLRKIILAVPVVYLAIRLFVYNSQNLPEMVGLGLQSSGEFAVTVARGLATTGPFALTMGCLVLMFFSRKVMYSWVISIFTLTLPLLILVSNLYPA